MSVIDTSLTAARYGELAGARILITGVSPVAGLDVARAFADHRARLVVQTAPGDDVDATEPETAAMLTMLAETAHDITVFDTPVRTVAQARRLAQNGARAFGGLDAVVNVVAVDAAAMARARTTADVEALAVDTLAPMLEISRVCANRMRLTLTDGAILNVVLPIGPIGSRASVVAGYLRSALATITRREAIAWAPYGIRVNAIGPQVSLPGERSAMGLASEPEIAAVALFLASKRGRTLSGHLFDAEGVLTC